MGPCKHPVKSIEKEAAIGIPGWGGRTQISSIPLGGTLYYIGQRPENQLTMNRMREISQKVHQRPKEGPRQL